MKRKEAEIESRLREREREKEVEAIVMKKITIEKMYEEVPKKQLSKSLNFKLVNASKKAMLLSRLKPLQNSN